MSNKKNVRSYTSKLILLLTIFFIFNSSVIHAESSNKDSSFEIGLEGEIPFLLKYSNKISGLSSNNLYLGVPLKRNGISSHSFFVCLNATIYEYTPIYDYNETKGYTFGMGWLPVNPVVLLLAFGGGADYVTLYSPAAGYSYSRNFSDDIDVSVKVSTGAAYALVGKPIEQSSENETAKMLEGYEAVNGIDKKYGCRINGRLKLSFKDSNFKDTGFMYGVTAGYTQYIFRDYNFNSIDLGTFISFQF